MHNILADRTGIPRMVCRVHQQRDPAAYCQALAHLIAETRQGRMFGQWDDYGRLTSIEN